jgi:hypothetical protein
MHCHTARAPAGDSDTARICKLTQKAAQFWDDLQLRIKSNFQNNCRQYDPRKYAELNELPRSWDGLGWAGPENKYPSAMGKEQP